MCPGLPLLQTRALSTSGASELASAPRYSDRVWQQSSAIVIRRYEQVSFWNGSRGFPISAVRSRLARSAYWQHISKDIYSYCAAQYMEGFWARHDGGNNAFRRISSALCGLPHNGPAV